MNARSIAGLFRRLGCWSVGVFLFALFFGIGALVSLFGGDIMIALQGLVLAVAVAGLGVWLGRKHALRRREK